MSINLALTEEKRPSNFKALDGIRGLAILLVMAHHATQLLPKGGFIPTAITTLLRYGWCGVDLFFTLSGFLITHLLLQTVGAKNYFSGFYVRRILRIFPLYYLVLTTILLVASVIKPLAIVTPLPADRKLYFLYLTNWLFLWKGRWQANMIGHFWSLAVEEQFYLVWPLCVLVFSRGRLIKVAVFLSLLAPLIRLYWISQTGPGPAIALATVTRMDSLLWGAVAAILYLNTHVRRHPRLPVLVGCAALAIFAVGLLPFGFDSDRAAAFYQGSGYSLLAVGFSSLVLYAATTDQSRNLLQSIFRNRILTNFGRYSYGMYVYHVPVIFVFQAVLVAFVPAPLVQSAWFAYSALGCFVGLNFVIAKVSYEEFESHFLSLKKYFVAKFEEPERLSTSPVAAEARGASV